MLISVVPAQRYASALQHCQRDIFRRALHPEKYLQNALKFLSQGADNSFNREKALSPASHSSKHKELQAGVLDWAAAAAHPEKSQVTVAATF